MRKEDIFRVLVAYHQEQLERCFPYVRGGKITNHGQPLQVGLGENDLYRGVLIVANGNTLADRLTSDAVALSGHDPFVSTQTSHDFQSYLASQPNNDGAFVFDGVNQRIARVPELNNNPASLERTLDLYALVPSNFVAYDGSVPVRGNLGTKTRLAIKIPLAYPDTDTFQIKRTAYTPLGMGKVTHFTRDGLKEEFFYQLRDAQTVQGVYRMYAPAKQGLRLVDERLGEQVAIPKPSRWRPAWLASVGMTLQHYAGAAGKI